MSSKFKVRLHQEDIIIMLLVVLPILILFLAMMPRAWTLGKESKALVTRCTLESLVTAIEEYRLDFGDYPSEDTLPTGCSNMIRCLLTTKIRGPYIHVGSKRIRPDGQMVDGWRRPFIYRYQSAKNSVRGYDIYSSGQNGIDEYDLPTKGDDITY